MNDSKTEFIYFGWPSQLGKCITNSININNEIVERSTSTKYSINVNNENCLVQLHWLPIKYRIDYKIISIVYRCLHGEALPYLTRMIEYIKPTRQGLCSEKDNTRLLVPKTSKKTFAARSFSMLGPTLWNTLPLGHQENRQLCELQEES